MSEKWPCGCYIGKYRVGTPAGDSEWSHDETLHRCVTHQAEFDKAFGWDIKTQCWVPRTAAYEKRQSLMRLRYLENAVQRLRSELSIAIAERDAYIKDHELLPAVDEGPPAP
jgi:hypothetical protein